MERFRAAVTVALFLAAPLRGADEMSRAAALVNQGRHAEAAAAYEALIARDPGNASLHHSLGLCRQSMKDFPGAVASLERAVSLSADPSEPAYSLALLHEAQARGGDRRGSLRSAREAWRLVAAHGRGEALRTAARHMERIDEELR